MDEYYDRKVKSGLLSADDLNAIRNHFGLDSRSFKGVEGSARNDGVGGNGDGGVGNGDAAEASAESPVKAAKGGGNQGATISPDGDKQRTESKVSLEGLERRIRVANRLIARHASGVGRVVCNSSAEAPAAQGGHSQAVWGGAGAGMRSV